MRWFNPNKENAFFPLPLLGLCVVLTLLLLYKFGSFGRLARFVVFYGVWSSAVGIIMYAGSTILHQAKRRIDPERNERRLNVYGALRMGLFATGAFLAYEAAVMLQGLW